MKNTLIGFIAGLIAAAILTAAVHLYRHFEPRQSVPAAVAPELRKQKTETIAVAQGVQVFAAPTKKALGLPAAVQSSPDAHVVAATKASASTHPQTVTAVLDTKTGETQLYVRTDPLPWFTLEQHGEASLSRGFRDSALVYRLGVREDFAQVKSAHLGLVGSLDSDREWYAGIGLRLTW